MEKLFVLTVVMLMMANYAIAQGEESVEEHIEECDSYNYCQGENFPESFLVYGRQVSCDITPDPRDRCCLTRSHHRVCYNIKVDGLHLNYAMDNVFMSTNFTGLCQGMIRSVGLQLNRHTAATLAGEGGTLIWRSDRWQIVQDNANDEHLFTLACGYFT